LATLVGMPHHRRSCARCPCGRRLSACVSLSCTRNCHNCHTQQSMSIFRSKIPLQVDFVSQLFLTQGILFCLTFVVLILEAPPSPLGRRLYKHGAEFRGAQASLQTRPTPTSAYTPYASAVYRRKLCALSQQAMYAVRIEKLPHSSPHVVRASATSPAPGGASGRTHPHDLGGPDQEVEDQGRPRILISQHPLSRGHPL